MSERLGSTSTRPPVYFSSLGFFGFLGRPVSPSPLIIFSKSPNGSSSDKLKSSVFLGLKVSFLSFRISSSFELSSLIFSIRSSTDFFGLPYSFIGFLGLNGWPVSSIGSLTTVSSNTSSLIFIFSIPDAGFLKILSICFLNSSVISPNSFLANCMIASLLIPWLTRDLAAVKNLFIASLFNDILSSTLSS